MFLKRERRIVGLVLAACLTCTAEFEVLAANPQSEAQGEAQVIVTNYETEMSPLAEVWEQIPTMASVAVDTQVWYGKALANTDSQLYIYTDMSEASPIVGVMYNNTAVTVDEVGAEWTKVTSGEITGYARNEVLLTGIDAVERAKVTCVNGTSDARSYEDLSIEKMLAALIFCEAGNQPYDGKVAVGAVVMNRVASGRFPNTIKEVIYQRGQFTPAMTGKLDRIIASGRIPASCYEAAREALSGVSTVGNALFFNTGHGAFKLGDHYFS